MDSAITALLWVLTAAVAGYTLLVGGLAALIIGSALIDIFSSRKR